MTRTDKDCGCTTAKEPCAEFPALVRMNYFHGQLISERDLKTEQAYFRERLRHMNRCLHGYGIICGLGVSALDTQPDCIDETDPDDEERREELRELDQRLDDIKARIEQTEDEETRKRLEEEYEKTAARREELLREIEADGKGRREEEPNEDSQGHCSDADAALHMVTVDCGAAIDCHGNDLVARTPTQIDLAKLGGDKARRAMADGKDITIWLMICHVECGIEPTRPFEMDRCATGIACVDSRLREDVRFEARLEKPDFEERCDGCCSSCKDACLLLAAITLRPGKPVRQADIDMSGRRPLGLYHPVTISGVSWHHGASYDAKTANQLLGTKDDDGGLLIRFSRDVRVSTIHPGVVEVLRFAGGRGVSGIVTGVDGEFVDLPEEGYVREVRWRDTTGETVQPRDRILVQVRGDFILDKCCKPVAAAHIGGRVPALPEAPEPKDKPDRETECLSPPEAPMPWTSGHGGLFESWFHVADD